MMGWLIFAVVVAALLALPMLLERRRQSMNRNARANAPGRFAELPQGVTHYKWNGPKNGQIAVCIHGLTTPEYVWDAVSDVLAHMGFRVLTYDLYGRGYSDRPRGVQNADFFLNQLDALLEHLEIDEPVTLFGYSMGGAIATAYAAEHPEQLERLVLLAPAGLGHDLGGVMKFAVNTPVAGDWLVAVIGGIMLRRGVQEEAKHVVSLVPGIHEKQMDETRYRGYLRSVLSSMRHLLKHKQIKQHRAIAETDLPVLAIWAEADDVIPLQGLGKLAEIHRDVRQVSIPGAPHALAYTHPAEIRTALQELMRDGL